MDVIHGVGHVLEEATEGHEEVPVLIASVAAGEEQEGPQKLVRTPDLIGSMLDILSLPENRIFLEGSWWRWF